MNIVAVNGSPTGAQGSTGRLLAALIDGAREQGAAVTLFELASLEVRPCTSCRTCQREGVCSIGDDYPRIKAALMAADGFVLASPNYISSVSAQLKALLDRSFSMIHCQALRGKYSACVVAAGSPMYQKPVDYLTQVCASMGCWRVGCAATGGGALDDPGQAPDVLAEARSLGADLTAAIREKKRFPDQEEQLAETFEIMRWVVEERRDAWPYEYQYWQTHWK